MAAFWACNELTRQNDCILRQDLKAVALARIYGRRDSAAISRGNCDRWQLWNLNKHFEILDTIFSLFMKLLTAYIELRTAYIQ